MVVKNYSTDSLRSLLGGLGDPMRDKSAGAYYSMPFVDDMQLMNAYRGSWLPRKIVNIPARDSVRKWRDWQADKDVITQIEAEENRLMLRQRVEEARVRARLLGGAAIFIGSDDIIGGDAAALKQPFDPLKVKRGGIKYLTVMSRVELTASLAMNVDPISPYFGKPEFYTVRGRDIHPSRLAIFVGDPHPEPFYNFGVTTGWGDSVLCALFEAMKHLDSTMANIASLVYEANVDVFGIPDFLDSLGDPEYVNRFTNRMSLVAANKGINGSLMHDALETYDRKGVTFGGLPELIDKFMQIVSGASDIPATRLLGMSPAGMSSTGESDLRNYYDRIAADQSLIITPATHLLDEALICSALGSRPEDVHYIWSSLWQISDEERSKIGKTIAETADIVNRTGLISPEALSTSLVNSMVEHSIFPGLEQAVEDAPIDFEAEAQRAAEEALVTDATPESLYIKRDVVNRAEIVAWARSQGFADALIEDGLHVTIAYSRTAIDWFKVGEPWSSKITIAAGGPRKVEQFDGGAIVLLIACSELQWRHRAVIEAGGTSDYAEYQPHITISYADTDLDLSAIEPYQGEIVLGPEIFQKVKNT